MAKVGDLFKPTEAAPEAGNYQCSAFGCTQVFKTSVRGTPLPSAHHPGSIWKLTGLIAQVSATTPAQTKPSKGAKPAVPGEVPMVAKPPVGQATKPASQPGAPPAKPLR